MPRGKATRVAAAAGVGYLLGTLPSADIAARLATGGAVDLRHEGSGNPGGTNVAQLVGPGWGLGVMMVDLGKGLVASRIGLGLAAAGGANAAGTAAVIGHCLPVWNRWRGGKGVATSVGQVLGTFPAYFPIDFTVAATTLATHRFERQAFAATALASATWVIAGVVWWRRQLPNWWGPTPTGSLPVAAAASSAVVLARFLAASDLDPEADPAASAEDDR